MNHLMLFIISTKIKLIILLLVMGGMVGCELPEELEEDPSKIARLLPEEVIELGSVSFKVEGPGCLQEGEYNLNETQENRFGGSEQMIEVQWTGTRYVLIMFEMVGARVEPYPSFRRLMFYVEPEFPTSLPQLRTEEGDCRMTEFSLSAHESLQKNL